MNNDTNGLVEGVGQSLQVLGDSTAPPQPQEGQWTFRFNYTDTTKVTVLVSVSFSAPFASTAELSSEMSKTQVERLKDWLTNVYNAMNGGGT
jgi:hypothetical protein